MGATAVADQAADGGRERSVALPGTSARCVAPSASPNAYERWTTSAADLARFEGALQRRKLAGEAGWRELTSGGVLRDGLETGWANGWVLGALDDVPGRAFAGALGRERICVASYPQAELVVAVALEGPGDPERVARRVARLVLDRPEPGPRALPLDAARAQRYIGGYYVGCSRIEIAFTAKGLVARHWDVEERELHWQGADVFLAADDPDIRYAFQVEQSRASAFVLHDHGYESLARRLD
jgi:hypothetical protein